MDSVTCTVRMDFDTFRDFTVFSAFRGRRFRYARAFAYLPSAIMLAGGVVSLLAPFSATLTVAMFVTAVLVALYFTDFLFFMPKRNYRRLPPAFFLPQTFTFLAEELVAEKDSGDRRIVTHLAYRDLAVSYETESAFYFYLSRSQALIVPKKGILTEEAAFIRETVRGSVPAKQFRSIVKSKDSLRQSS